MNTELSIGLMKGKEADFLTSASWDDPLVVCGL